MSLTLIVTTSLITILFFRNIAASYKFEQNTTFLKDPIREAPTSDLYSVKHTNGAILIPNKRYLLIIITKHNIKKNSIREDDFKGALRTNFHKSHLEKKARKEKVKSDYLQLLKAERARKLNAFRVNEVKRFMKYSYKATEYLFGEVQRILRNKVILDGPRKIIADVEASENATFIKAMSKCIYNYMKSHGYDAWHALPNKITWHTIGVAEDDGLD